MGSWRRMGQGGERKVRRRAGQRAPASLGRQEHVSHTCRIGLSILFLSDAKDPDQLGRNKITHIISIHESPQPLLQVVLPPMPGLRIGGEGASDPHSTPLSSTCHVPGPILPS